MMYNEWFVFKEGNGKAVNGGDGGGVGLNGWAISHLINFSLKSLNSIGINYFLLEAVPGVKIHIGKPLVSSVLHTNKSSRSSLPKSVFSSCLYHYNETLI